MKTLLVKAFLLLLYCNCYSQLSVDIFSTNVSCFGGNNGSARASAYGACGGPRTYTWKNSSNAIIDSDSIAINLTAGTYTVSVFDFGCFTFLLNSVIITEPSKLTVAPSVLNNNCNGGSEGLIVAETSGGTNPYTFRWSNAATDSIAKNLAAGTYTVTVTDANACKEIIPVAVTEPSAIIIYTSKTDASCKGGKDGVANVDSITGGTPFFTVKWNTGSASTTITSLYAGTYTVTAIDGFSCKKAATVTVSEPSALLVPTFSTDATCNGGSDGTASVAPLGGTAPYAYKWSNGVLTAAVTGLISGFYTCTVSDAKNCKQNGIVNISQPSAIVPTTSKTDPSCDGASDGTAKVTASGGTPGYVYKWTTGATTTNISGLASGTYTITVTDTIGCKKTATVTLSNPATISLSPTVSNVSCFGGANGFVEVLASGGSSPYTYSWSNGSTIKSESNLTAGTYSITVFDNNNCFNVTFPAVSQPSKINIITLSTTNISCNGQKDGSAKVTATGGTGTLVYTWSEGTVNNTVTLLDTGTFKVVVSDVFNCQDSSSVTITQPGPIVPNEVVTNTSCYGGNDGTITVSIAGGNAPFTFSWSSSGNTDSSETGLSANDYTYIVTDATGCSDTNKSTVFQPDSLSLNMSNTNATCFGKNDGTAKVSTSGGTKPYTYLWSNSITDSFLVNVIAGTYTVTLRDNKNCTKGKSVTISQPTQIFVLATATSPTICTGQTTKLIASGSGGFGKYTYTWDNGAGTGDTVSVSPTSSITYTVTAFDSAACTADTTITILVNTPLLLKTDSTTVTCKGENVTLSTTGSGGDGNYTYTWDNGTDGVGVGPSVSVIPDSNSTYYVTLQDGCGTTPVKDSIEVKILEVAFTADTTKGCNTIDVKFSDASTNATSWVWDFGDGTTDTLQNPTHTFSSIGGFDVKLSVKTPQGCIGSSNKTSFITVYSVPAANFSYTPTTITLVDPVSFVNASSNSTSWNWDFGDEKTDTANNPVHAYDLPGAHSVQLIAFNPAGCSDTTISTINVVAEFAYYIPSAFSPNSDGLNDEFNGAGIGIKESALFIYDKWGGIIFESFDPNVGWNGKHLNTGGLLKNGIYAYRAVIIDFNGEEHIFQGHVTLIK